MATAWTDGVKNGGKLAVFAGASVRGHWATVLREALDAFNALSKHHGLGVTLVKATTAPTETGGADVAVALGSGAVSASWGGETHDGNFDGTRMHGLTMQFVRGGSIGKAFIFLPERPQVNTPSGVRPVGDNVMKLIAVHELVHACGLENGDHVTDDLFQASPQVDPGDKPSQDRIRIGTGSPMKWMPPLVLGGSTVTALKRLWS